MSISLVDIDSIRPMSRNPRSHDERAVQELMKALRRFGKRTPLKVGRGREIAKGNRTWRALKELGARKVWISSCEDLSATELRAYALSDNRQFELSGWDFPQVAIDLRFLAAEGGLEGLGYTEDEAKALTGALERSLAKEQPIEIDEGEGYKQLVTCPKCKHEFKI